MNRGLSNWGQARAPTWFDGEHKM